MLTVPPSLRPLIAALLIVAILAKVYMAIPQEGIVLGILSSGLLLAGVVLAVTVADFLYNPRRQQLAGPAIAVFLVSPYYFVMLLNQYQTPVAQAGVTIGFICVLGLSVLVVRKFG